MPYYCQYCGFEEAESICSATNTLICIGYGGMEGCGKVLTPHERHYYGNCCEMCMQARDDAIADWLLTG